jgi:hypothetical protein
MRDSYKDLVKFGVENSSTPVSKAAQGSKQHKTDVLTYIEKMRDMHEPKFADQKIFENNINKKPTYRKEADPVTFGKAAERIERARQMTGEKKQLSSWEIMKKAADTPQEKKEIREIIREDYKKNGPKNMDPDDLKLIGKGKITPNIKIDVSGISESINNYINATSAPEPVPPPKKQRDPDLDLGLASLIGGSNEF